MKHSDTEDTEKKERTGPLSSLCSLCLGGKYSSYFRHIAELGIQAAEALDHAHEQGIVHRDIKPANLLLQSFPSPLVGEGKGGGISSGHLWITDFGLAHFQTDAALTMSGDLIGTLRYMSPEQALAKRVPIDHRTDIYSLGATLYELLTLHPVIDGADRSEILRKLTLEEPMPLRKWNKSIPPELETIVLKALEKSPECRYGTAKELADDLRRWTLHEPIKAKPPGFLQHSRKWCRRHRHLVSVFVAALVVVAIALVLGMTLIWNEKDKTSAALDEARANFFRAEKQRERAESNFQSACGALEEVLSAHNPIGSSGPVSVERWRRWQADRALQFFDRFRTDPSHEPSVEMQRSEAFMQIGRVHQFLGNQEKSWNAFRQAILIMERLAREEPLDIGYPLMLASEIIILASEEYQAGRVAAGNEHFRWAVNVLWQTLRKHPESMETRLKLAHIQCVWFETALRDPATAIDLCQRAAQHTSDDARAWMILGMAYCRAAKWNLAVESLELGLRKSGDWSRRDPWTQSLFFLAIAQSRCGKHDEALTTYGRADRLMLDNPVARGDPFNRALRAEAAELFAVPAQTPANTNQKPPSNY